VRHPQLININHTILKLRHSMPNVGAWRKLWECFNKMLAWGCCLPSSSAGKLAHALSTRTKVNLSGLIPSCFICWKSLIVFSYCPAFTYLASLFHEKMLNCTVLGAIAASSASTHGGFKLSLSQSPSHVFLCLKSGYLAFPYNQRTNSSSSAVHSQSPGYSDPNKKRVPASCINEKFWTWMGTFTFSALWSHHCDGSENILRHRFSTILFWSVRSHLTWLEIYNLQGHFFSQCHGTALHTGHTKLLYPLQGVREMFF